MISLMLVLSYLCKFFTINEHARSTSVCVAYLKALPKKIRTLSGCFLNKPLVRASHKFEQLSFLTATYFHPLLSPVAVTAEMHRLKGEPCEHLIPPLPTPNLSLPPFLPLWLPEIT